MENLIRSSKSVTLLVLILFITGCNGKPCTQPSFYRGKDIFVQNCNSCHQYRIVENWTAPPLSVISLYDSSVLDRKLKKTFSERSHKNYIRNLSDKDICDLTFFIAKYLDPKASKEESRKE